MVRGEREEELSCPPSFPSLSSSPSSVPSPRKTRRNSRKHRDLFRRLSSHADNSSCVCVHVRVCEPEAKSPFSKMASGGGERGCVEGPKNKQRQAITHMHARTHNTFSVHLWCHKVNLSCPAITVRTPLADLGPLRGAAKVGSSLPTETILPKSYVLLRSDCAVEAHARLHPPQNSPEM